MHFATFCLEHVNGGVCRGGVLLECVHLEDEYLS